MKGNIKQKHLNNNRLKIGQRLKEIRIERNLTHADMADLTGMNAATISKIENGKWNFGIDTITLFSKHLNFNLILKHEDNETSSNDLQ